MGRKGDATIRSIYHTIMMRVTAKKNCFGISIKKRKKKKNTLEKSPSLFFHPSLQISVVHVLSKLSYLFCLEGFHLLVLSTYNLTMTLAGRVVLQDSSSRLQFKL